MKREEKFVPVIVSTSDPNIPCNCVVLPTSEMAEEFLTTGHTTNVVDVNAFLAANGYVDHGVPDGSAIMLVDYRMAPGGFPMCREFAEEIALNMNL